MSRRSFPLPLRLFAKRYQDGVSRKLLAPNSPFSETQAAWCLAEAPRLPFAPSAKRKQHGASQKLLASQSPLAKRYHDDVSRKLLAFQSPFNETQSAMASRRSSSSPLWRNVMMMVSRRSFSPHGTPSSRYPLALWRIVITMVSRRASRFFAKRYQYGVLLAFWQSTISTCLLAKRHNDGVSFR